MFGYQGSGHNPDSINNLLVFAGDRVKCRFDLKRGHIRMPLQQQRNDSDYMRAGKTVARKVAITAAWPRGSHIYAGSGQLDDLAVVKAKFQWIGLLAFYNRDQRG